ncbi:hypothetical protein V5799_025742, partial [Amblyomma americanum]
ANCSRPADTVSHARRARSTRQPLPVTTLAVSEPEDQPSPSAAASSAGSEPSTELESASQALETIGAAPSETMLLLESPQSAALSSTSSLLHADYLSSSFTAEESLSLSEELKLPGLDLVGAQVPSEVFGSTVREVSSYQEMFQSGFPVVSSPPLTEQPTPLTPLSISPANPSALPSFEETYSPRRDITHSGVFSFKFEELRTDAELPAEAGSPEAYQVSVGGFSPKPHTSTAYRPPFTPPPPPPAMAGSSQEFYKTEPPSYQSSSCYVQYQAEQEHAKAGFSGYLHPSPPVFQKGLVFPGPSESSSFSLVSAGSSSSLTSFPGDLTPPLPSPGGSWPQARKPPLLKASAAATTASETG